ncbi:hypothetical protein [Micromonospora sp. NPDC004551]|uniref:hypothetical protein n=1 Tax=Micromonospora sp. NPDC004551 TaxID=3154284 RepID=UPI0033B77435
MTEPPRFPPDLINALCEWIAGYRLGDRQAQIVNGRAPEQTSKRPKQHPKAGLRTSRASLPRP